MSEQSEFYNKVFDENLSELVNQRDKYKQALDDIENIIKELSTENILTFPDLSLQENARAIMRQCNSGYEDILGIINKAKEQ